MLHRRAAALVVAASVAVAGCDVLGVRESVTRDQAQDLLAQAVGLTASGQLDRLCELSESAASTCAETLADARDLAPEEGPRVTCTVSAPDVGPLRGGVVLVLDGTDANGDPYTTEFVVFDDGDAVGVLDPVWWSGLSIASYSEDTVTWRHDSASTLCADGALPGADALGDPEPTPSRT